MSHLACFHIPISWPVLLFVCGVFLAFASLIVGGIAWIASGVFGVSGWKVLCIEAIGFVFAAMISWPFGFIGEGIAFLCLLGAGTSLFLLAVKWLFRRFGSAAESGEAFKPYSFNLNEYSPVSASTTE
ncbi:MAG: hypothetical protein AAB401_08440 [Acidobacteriota bacterium]